MSGCTTSALKAVQMTASVVATVRQTQAIAAQAILWPLALDVDRSGTLDDVLARSQALATAESSCVTSSVNGNELTLDFGPADNPTPCLYRGRALSGLAVIRWIETEPGGIRRAFAEFERFGTTGAVFVDGEAYFEPLDVRSVSIDSEIEVEDPDVTSFAVGVVIADFMESDPATAELNGTWTWQSNSVGWQAELLQAEIELGTTAPYAGFYEVDPTTETPVMIQFAAEGVDLVAWANGGARDRKYIIEADASVTEP